MTEPFFEQSLTGGFWSAAFSAISSDCRKCRVCFSSPASLTSFPFSIIRHLLHLFLPPYQFSLVPNPFWYSSWLQISRTFLFWTGASSTNCTWWYIAVVKILKIKGRDSHWWCGSIVDDNDPLSSLVVPSKTDEDAKCYYQLDKSWKIRRLMDVARKKGEINDTAVLTLMCAKSRSESVKSGKSAR